MANVYISTTTNLAFVNTTARSGVIFMPSTTTSLGRTLTFKDVGGNFARSTITFSTLLGDTFEDGTIRQIYNDTYGAYSFTAGQNKWYVTGGARMNSATISTLFTSTLNTFGVSTLQVAASTITLMDKSFVGSNYPLYGKSNALFFGNNAWGGARTATSLSLPLGPAYTIGGRIIATGGTITTVTSGATYTVHTFTTGLNQTFTVTRPGYAEFVLIGAGGNGGAGAANSYGGGGGGGGGVTDTTGFLFYFPSGTYTINVAATNANITSITGPGTFSYAANSGANGTSGNGVTGSGGQGGISGYVGVPLPQYGYTSTLGGAGNVTGSIFAGGGGGGWISGVDSVGAGGGNGGSGVNVLNYATNLTITSCCGGGGGGGNSTGQTTGGAGGTPFSGGTSFGGNGGTGSATAGGSGTAATGFGNGGGGGGGGATSGGGGGAGTGGQCWIRYATFSTIIR